MSTVPLTIRLPRSVYDRLTSEAVDEGDYSPSVLARHILADWVQHIEFGAPGENDFARFWADARPQAQPDDVASALVKFLLSPLISVKLSSDDNVQALRSESRSSRLSSKRLPWSSSVFKVSMLMNAI